MALLQMIVHINLKLPKRLAPTSCLSDQNYFWFACVDVISAKLVLKFALKILSRECLQSSVYFSQRAKKVVSDSPGLVDFAIGLVNSVFNLPDGQVMFYEEFE